MLAKKKSSSALCQLQKWPFTTVNKHYSNRGNLKNGTIFSATKIYVQASGSKIYFRED